MSSHVMLCSTLIFVQHSLAYNEVKRCTNFLIMLHISYFTLESSLEGKYYEFMISIICISCPAAKQPPSPWRARTLLAQAPRRATRAARRLRDGSLEHEAFHSTQRHPCEAFVKPSEVFISYLKHYKSAPDSCKPRIPEVMQYFISLYIILMYNVHGYWICCDVLIRHPSHGESKIMHPYSIFR